MTEKHSFAFSRHDLPEVCKLVLLLSKREGAGNAGCALHPRSRVQCAQGSAHTSIQGSGGNPTFPAQWFYGLCHALPGDVFRLVTVADGLKDCLNPVGSTRL